MYRCVTLEIGTFQKLFLVLVTSVALKSCPSSKLVPGQLVVGYWKADEFVRPLNRRKPRSPVETQKTRTTPFGAGYTEYQPDTIFLDPSNEQDICIVNPLRSSNIGQVSSNQLGQHCQHAHMKCYVWLAASLKV